MNNSIFEEFYKIAAEKDLIDTRETRSKKQPSSEYSKEYIDTIKTLYNIDPTESKGKSITEQAHPETCVISPAYDKTWGVIQNGEEAQALNVDIVFKETNPTTNIRRIAEQELLEELIKSATVLELSEQIKIAELADECSVKLSADLEEGLKKKSWAFLLPVAKFLGTAAVPYIIGWLAEAPQVAKLKEDAKQQIIQDLLPAIEQAKEAIKDSYKEASDDQLKYTLKGWFKTIKFLQEKTLELKPVLSIENQKIDGKPETEEDAKVLTEKKEATEKEKQALEAYRKLIIAIKEKFQEDKQIFEQIQTQEDKDHEGVWGYIKEKAEDVIGDDSEKLLSSLEVLINSLSATEKTIKI